MADEIARTSSTGDDAAPMTGVPDAAPTGEESTATIAEGSSEAEADPTIDEVMREAERLMGEQAPALAAAAQSTDEFSLEDLQSAIDTALKEADERKQAQRAKPPAPSASAEPESASSASGVEASPVAEAALEGPSRTGEDAAPPVVDADAPAGVTETVATEDGSSDASAAGAGESVDAAVETEVTGGPTPEAHAASTDVEGAAPAESVPEAPVAEAHEAGGSDEDADFAAPEDVMEEAGEGAAVAAPADLDAALAAKAQAALEAEKAQDGVPSAAPAPAPVAPPPTTGAENKGAGEGTGTASSSVPKAPANAAAAAAPAGAEGPASEAAMARVGIGARVGRAVQGVLQGMTERYARIGEAPRKIVRFSAIGTLVQASIVWVWVLCIRSPELPVSPAHAEAPAGEHAGAGHDTKAPAKKESGGHGAPASDGHGAPAKKESGAKKDGHGAPAKKETPKKASPGASKKGSHGAASKKSEKKKAEPQGH
jgi:hypothetical protein